MQAAAAECCLGKSVKLELRPTVDQLLCQHAIILGSLGDLVASPAAEDLFVRSSEDALSGPRRKRKLDADCFVVEPRRQRLHTLGAGSNDLWHVSCS